MGRRLVIAGLATGLSPLEAGMLALGGVAALAVLLAPLAPWLRRRAGAPAARLWWRLVPLTPFGRRHERNVRRELGMGRWHPEHVTRHPSGRDARKLARLQAEAWPEGEWTWVIRMHLEGP